MITQDLGIATAYGYAKSKGYTGTEAEFAELMASYASTAQTAIEAADRAVEANTAAQSAKTDAATSKTAAQTAAQTATTKASEASQSASTATTKASEASQSASTASSAATSAGTSAQTATTAATTAITKASEAAASETAALSAKTDAESARDAAAQSASEAAASAESIDPETLEHKAYGAYVVESASGAVVSFPDGADNIPMKDVLVHIEPVQEGSGDPSPDNVRPITGWTGAKVMRTGKNLLNPTLASGTYTENGITWTLNNDGSVTVSGTATGTSYLWMYGSASIPIPSWMYKLAGKTVTASSGNGHFTQSGYASIQVILYGSPTLVIREETATIPSDLSPYTGFAIVLFVNTGNTVDATVYPQFELGSTATDYEPYSGQTYDITFPSEARTVYGGTLDVTTGELVVDKIGVDLTTGMSGGTAGAGYVFYKQLSNVQTVPNSQIADILNEAYTPIRFNAVSMESNTIALRDNQVLYVNTGSDSIYPVGKAILPLATPITYTLTPQETQEITSLLGENNLWTDTGDSEVEYRANTKLYITKKITEAVSALS